MSRDEVGDVSILGSVILFEGGIDSYFEYAVTTDACQVDFVGVIACLDLIGNAAAPTARRTPLWEGRLLGERRRRYGVAGIISLPRDTIEVAVIVHDGDASCPRAESRRTRTSLGGAAIEAGGKRVV